MATVVVCGECWKHGQPYQWNRNGKAPTIPRTRNQLLAALKMALPGLEEEYEGLLKPELAAYFRRHVRGTRCSSDPLAGISTLRKQEIVERCRAHGIHLEDSELKDLTKGDLILRLREHWNEQTDAFSKSSLDKTPVQETNAVSPSSDGWESVQ